MAFEFKYSIVFKVVVPSIAVSPLISKLAASISPVTSRVPAIDVFPLDAITLNLF